MYIVASIKAVKTISSVCVRTCTLYSVFVSYTYMYTVCGVDVLSLSIPPGIIKGAPTCAI